MPSGWERSPDYGGPEYTRRDWAIVLALAVVLFGAPAACVLMQSEQRQTPTWRVVDGDTVDIDGERWRLIGMDAPETSFSYGAECEEEIALGLAAEAYAVELFTAARRIETRQRKAGERDDTPSRRLLGFIILDGRDFAETMIASGHAKPWDYDGGEPKPDWCT